MLNWHALKKYSILLLGVIFVCLSCSCSSLPSASSENNKINEQAYDEALIGIWHAAPSVGAGYANLLYLYKDNKFYLAYSQYDEEKRVLNISGTWAINNQKLILSITQKTVVVGGELVDASPSASSKYSIKNGTIEEQSIDPAEIEEHTLGKIEEETDSPYSEKMLIDETYYWKISDNPFN